MLAALRLRPTNTIPGTERTRRAEKRNDQIFPNWPVLGFGGLDVDNPVAGLPVEDDTNIVERVTRICGACETLDLKLVRRETGNRWTRATPIQVVLDQLGLYDLVQDQMGRDTRKQIRSGTLYRWSWTSGLVYQRSQTNENYIERVPY